MGVPAHAAVETARGGLDEAPSYRSSLLSLHKTLVTIPSTSGSEQHVGDVLVDYLSSLGYKVERQPLPQSSADVTSPPRFNVLAWRPTSKSGRLASSKPGRVLVTSHIDAVPPHIPYSISDSTPGPDTIISGRGSVDDKASVAAQIVALEELRKGADIAGDEVLLLFVVGEETVGDGMRHFSAIARDQGRAFDAAVFGEPTEGKLACGHKGHAGCKITAKGKAGHSGYPWLGKSATEVIARVLVKIMDADLGSSERFGNTTVNIGLVEGGVAANVIAQSAKASIALRLAAGDQATGWGVVRKRLELLLADVDEDLTMECTNGYGPVECKCDVDGKYFLPLGYDVSAERLTRCRIRHHYRQLRNRRRES
jgi:acetylornithine deacetylase